MLTLLRGVSRRVKENGICYLGQDRGLLKEINPGGDEICLILGNPGETQPPPRVAISHQVFLPIFPVPRDQASPLGNPEDTEMEPTILCGTAVTWRKRKIIDIQHGRLGK